MNQKRCKHHGKIAPQSCKTRPKHHANIMQKSRNNHAKFTQKHVNIMQNRAKIMQKSFERHAKIVQKICKTIQR